MGLGNFKCADTRLGLNCAHFHEEKYFHPPNITWVGSVKHVYLIVNC